MERRSRNTIVVVVVVVVCSLFLQRIIVKSADRTETAWGVEPKVGVHVSDRKTTRPGKKPDPHAVSKTPRLLLLLLAFLG